MKKSFLAAAAILGAAVLAEEAHAAKINLGDGKSFKMGFRARIYGALQGARFKGNDTNEGLHLTIQNVRIYAGGSITKVFKWGFQTNASTGAHNVADAFVLLDLAKEFKVQAGAFKLPSVRHAGIDSGWARLLSFPRGFNVFGNPAFHTVSAGRSPQLAVWGDVAGGMIKYWASVTDHVTATGGLNNGDMTDPGYALRIQFTPPGFDGEKGYVIKNTYLGKKNLLAFGLAFFTQDQDRDGIAANGAEVKRTRWGVDFIYEAPMGGIVPNIQGSYVQNTDDPSGGTKVTSKGFLIQGQLYFKDVKTILGSPAVALRYSQTDPNDNVSGDKRSRLGGAIIMYVKGPTNRIALEFDNVKDDTRNAANQEDSWTDIRLSLWYNF